ncbi:hypothetical protein [Verrucosispora sp. ts21]|uniref:hypothetical protein n=1 Tax=Verrucosispora sp. ts21 TaxID=2069341 RepID=UPI001E51A8E9|nr:hypothetical protein [Verrucosispora sp. ts21]
MIRLKIEPATHATQHRQARPPGSRITPPRDHLAERRDKDRRKLLRQEPHTPVLQVRPEMIGGTVIRDEGGKLRQYVVSHRSGCSSTTDS